MSSAGEKRLRYPDPVQWIGLILFAYLFLLAWRFYLERMATQDSAFFTWMMIDAHAPYAALGRTGSWLAQLLPLALIHLRAPLEAVLRSYSLSIIGVHLLVFWIIAFRLRDQRAAIALPVTLVAATHLMFYFGISELYQGLSVLLLVWVLIDRCMRAGSVRAVRWWWIGAFLLNAWAAFHHQLLLLPLVFLLGYEAIAKGYVRSTRFWLLASVLVGWYVVRMIIIPASGYEEGRMPSVHDLIEHATRLNELRSTTYLLQVGLKFKAMILLVVVCVGVLIAQRKWRLLGWSVAFSVGFGMLILITDRDSGSPAICENYYPVLAFAWAVVLGDRWGTVRSVFARKARWGVLSAVLLFGGIQVWRGHHAYTARVDYMQRVTDNLRSRGIHKGAVDGRGFQWAYLYGTWPLAFESILVSAINGPEGSVTLFCGAEALRLDTVYHQKNAFLGPDWNPLAFKSDRLDTTYFHFDPEGYTKLSSVMPDSVRRSFRPGDIVLTPVDSVLRMVHDRSTVGTLRITNNTGLTLGSISEDENPLRLTYRIFNADGSLYAETAMRTELEMDVPPMSSYVHGLIIERPVDPGRYRVEVDLNTDAHGPMGIRTSFWVEVNRIF